MFILSHKLKLLKTELKVWNKESFGDVNLKVERAMCLVDDIQAKIANEGFQDSLHDLEVAAQHVLQMALPFQESFWKEKSRLNLFSHGDRNTSFFHRVTNIRNVSKQMSMLRQGGLIPDNVAYLENHVIEYYKSLYASSNSYVDNGLVDRVIPSLDSDEDNVMLSILPSMDDVKAAVFSMNGSGAPDGFEGCFYQAFWDTVGEDVFR